MAESNNKETLVDDQKNVSKGNIIKNLDADKNPQDGFEDSKYSEHDKSGKKANFDVQTKNGADDIIDKNTNQKPRDDI